MFPVSNLATNLSGVRTRIEQAALRVGRNASDIKLVAVSKNHPVPLLKEAMDTGVEIFGENKVQEAESKIEAIGRGSVEWHLIGHLQSNKARKAVQLFDVIHSVDSLDIARRLERICDEDGRDRLPVFVQVDIAGEETKSGIPEAELDVLVDYLISCSHLEFKGLMILPPYFENSNDVRPHFRKLREIRDSLADRNAFANGRGDLSMGMSHDFETAIEEGATIVRVGTAIFGERMRFE